MLAGVVLIAVGLIDAVIARRSPRHAAWETSIIIAAPAVTIGFWIYKHAIPTPHMGGLLASITVGLIATLTLAGLVALGDRVNGQRTEAAASSDDRRSTVSGVDSSIAPVPFHGRTVSTTTGHRTSWWLAVSLAVNVIAVTVALVRNRSRTTGDTGVAYLNDHQGAEA